MNKIQRSGKLIGEMLCDNDTLAGEVGTYLTPSALKAISDKVIGVEEHKYEPEDAEVWAVIDELEGSDIIDHIQGWDDEFRELIVKALLLD